jgi:hypothetical protein
MLPSDSEPGLPIYEQLLSTSLKRASDMTHNSVFILIDAYDEFRNAIDETRERNTFRHFLERLSFTHNVKILVSTRPYYAQDLLSSLQRPIAIEIGTDSENIQIYLDELLVNTKLKPRLVELVKGVILDRSNGWYLLQLELSQGV